MTNQPYSEGPLDCEICLIGEAPGNDEVLLRRPFVGAAGNLLDRLLAGAGINRSLCRIENVMQVQPPGNDISYYIDLGKKGRPRKPEFDEAAAALIERLEKCSANVFVPLGNVPLYVLTGLTAITKRRGSILSAVPETLRGRKVIPTIHPAAALRQFIQTHMISYDLRRIKEESLFPDIRLPRRQLLVNPSWSDVQNFLDHVELSPLCAADIEVKGNEISHISIATSPTFCMSIPFIDGMNDYWTPEQEASIWLRIAGILENPRIKKLFHNAAFDAAFMFRKMGILTKNYECTMVGFALLMPDLPKGLDFLTSIYCGGEPYYKDDGKKYIKNQFGSEEVFQRYNAMDSCTCFESWLHIEPELKRQGNWPFYEKQRDLIDPLTFMQERGIRMDMAGLKAAADNAEVKIAEYEAELHKLAGFPLNVNSNKQMRGYFYSIKGFKPYHNKDGGETVDDMALKRMSIKGCREAELVRLIRELRKAKGTYYEIGVDEDNRLRCSFNPVGTNSTRLSSSKTIFDTGGNLQNQPPEMLAFMLADEGYVLCKFDLGQAENRTAAYIAGCAKSMKAFEDGQDIHSVTAALIFGIPVDQVSDEEGSSELGSGAYSQRFWGKKANHSLDGGMGFRSFALKFEMPENQAKFIVDRYHAAYPEINQWHSDVVKTLSKGRTLVDCFGCKRTFIDRWGTDLFLDAYRWMLQSTVAKQTNYYGVTPIYYDQEKFGPVELINQVHDAVYFQVPANIGIQRITTILLAIKTSLQTPLRWADRVFSIPADCAIGLNAKECQKRKDGTIDNPEGMHKIKKVNIETITKVLNDLGVADASQTD